MIAFLANNFSLVPVDNGKEKEMMGEPFSSLQFIYKQAIKKKWTMQRKVERHAKLFPIITGFTDQFTVINW